eukprot:TRINITY_DN75661_c0_g1_i1.p1 TRINITY_DN75661_c0_g1~~TRINITY_DN75661_c0_g1_i1.p1  ORF type:complete len:459 (+),score=66.56 TRINITY_DN75661_c0_g1_i1:66-1442(+)
MRSGRVSHAFPFAQGNGAIRSLCACIRCFGTSSGPARICWIRKWFDGWHRLWRGSSEGGEASRTAPSSTNSANACEDPLHAAALRSQLGLDGSVGALLRCNRESVEAAAFKERTRLEAELTQMRFGLVTQLENFGMHLNAKRFEELHASWKSFLSLEVKVQAAQKSFGVADADLTSSKWKLSTFAKYVEKFAVQQWVFSTCQASPPKPSNLTKDLDWVRFVELGSFLKSDTASSRASALRALENSGSRPSLVDDSDWVDCALTNLDIMLAGVGVGTGDSASVDGSSDKSFLRLVGLPARGGKEVVSRVAIDAVLLPLCARMGVIVELEESCESKDGDLPRCICDYVLRRKSAERPVLGIVEAKRCTADSWQTAMVQAVVQCAMQLLVVQRRHRVLSGDGSKATDGSHMARPLFGLITDGRRWLCLDLHNDHMALTPVLDVINEASLRLLWRFLAERLT